MRLFMLLALLLVPVQAYGWGVTNYQVVEGGGAEWTIDDDFSSDTTGDYTDIVAGRGLAISIETAIQEGNEWAFGAAYHSTSLSSANMKVQAVLNIGSSVNKCGAMLVIRADGNGTSTVGYRVGVNRATGGVSIESIAGTWIDDFDFTSYSFAFGEAHLVEVEVNASDEFTLKVDWNDDLDFDDTDEISITTVVNSDVIGNYFGALWNDNGEHCYIDNLKAVEL